MDEDDTCTVLSKGINIHELTTSGTEFHLDMNFKGRRNRDPLLFDDNDLLGEDSDDSDIDEILKSMESTVESELLTAPEYTSFKEIATKMTDCIPSGEVKILIVEEGDGPLVPTDASVTIHYSAYWEHEKVPFDSTLNCNNGTPSTFRLGSLALIPGLEIGITSVKGPEARFHLLIQPNLAWGKNGVLPRIRPEPVLFSVLLLGIKDLSVVDRFNDLPSFEQKRYETTLKTVTASNLHAKELFNKKRYEKSAKMYHKSLSILQLSLPETEEQTTVVNELIKKVYINLAVCYNKLNRPKRITQLLDELGNLYPVGNNAKCLYLYGRAFYLEGHYEKAVESFEKSLKIEPKNPDIGKALAEIDVILKNNKNNEKAMWGKVFGAVPTLEFNVDEDFKESMLQTCENLNSRVGYSKFELPVGLTNQEVDFIKHVVNDFEKLTVLEDDSKGKKIISIVKKL